VDIDAWLPTQKHQHQMATKGTGRPPPIMLTSTVNLLRIQTDISEIKKSRLDFRTTRKVSELWRKKWQVIQP